MISIFRGLFLKSFLSFLLDACVSRKSRVASLHYPKKKGANSHLARELVYKPHVGPLFVVDLSVFPTEGLNSQKNGVHQPIHGRHVDRPLLSLLAFFLLISEDFCFFLILLAIAVFSAHLSEGLKTLRSLRKESKTQKSSRGTKEKVNNVGMMR